MAEEKIFLDESGVKVTNARFVTMGKTHSMGGITSVSSYKIEPSKKYPLIVAALGVILLLFKLWVFGAILLVAGIAWFLSLKPEFSVILQSASGSEDALTDKNEEFIHRVVDALNEAIVHRG